MFLNDQQSTFDSLRVRHSGILGRGESAVYARQPVLKTAQPVCCIAAHLQTRKHRRLFSAPVFVFHGPPLLAGATGAFCDLCSLNSVPFTQRQPEQRRQQQWQQSSALSRSVFLTGVWTACANWAITDEFRCKGDGVRERGREGWETVSFTRR